MTPQERELILGVAQRLRNTNLSQKDADAERLIQNEIGVQRDALYLLTQAVIVQEQGLRQAQERIRQLESAASSGHGSFLGNLFGGGSSPPPPATPPPATPPPQPVQAGHGGVGTFLGTAAAAAAGAVGGQLIFDGLRHLAGGGAGVPWPQGGGSPFAGGNELPRGRSSPPPVESSQDTDYSGTGGDFGDEDDQGSGGNLSGDSDYSGGGDDFDDTGDEDDFGDGDFADNDSGGGGDF